MMAASKTLNLYDTTIPMIISSLRNLSDVLNKGQQHLEARSLPESTLLEGRIAPDMKPLPFQIQTACNSSKFVVVRLTGMTLQTFSDDEKTYSDLQQRIENTIDMLEKDVQRDAFEGAEAKEIEFNGMKWTGISYVHGFAVPNFFFHVACAYLILRAKGVDIGKMDYLAGSRADDLKKK